MKSVTISSSNFFPSSSNSYRRVVTAGIPKEPRLAGVDPSIQNEDEMEEAPNEGKESPKPKPNPLNAGLEAKESKNEEVVEATGTLGLFNESSKAPKIREEAGSIAEGRPKGLDNADEENNESFPSPRPTEEVNELPRNEILEGAGGLFKSLKDKLAYGSEFIGKEFKFNEFNAEVALKSEGLEPKIEDKRDESIVFR